MSRYRLHLLAVECFGACGFALVMACAARLLPQEKRPTS